MVGYLLDGVVEKSAYLTKKDELIRRKVDLEQKKADFGQKGNNWFERLTTLKNWLFQTILMKSKRLSEKLEQNYHLANKNASLSFGAGWRIVAKSAYLSYRRKTS